ncbi:MAG: ABC transporter permease [Acidobacteriota bacterium]|nr:ABC transporter permease [Acidobacteriota bacterium]
MTRHRRATAALRLLRTAALAVVRLASAVVPRRDRPAWRREWEAEIHYEAGRIGDAQSGASPFVLLQRSSGAFSDAAWLRRQFTGDAEMFQDLRHAVRLLAARPAFSLVAIFILALGVGSATAIFSVVDALLLRALPFPAADRLVAVWQRDTSAGDARQDVSPGNFLAWRERTTTLEAIASVEPWSLDYTTGGQPRVLVGSQVSERFFDILGVSPLHGRFFNAADHQPGRSRVVVLDHAAWQREFGGDTSILGRAIVLDAEPYTVVGVLPPAFELTLLPGPVRREFYRPKVFEDYERRTFSGWWAAIGRLKPGVTREAAQAEFDAISAQMAAEFPRTNARTAAAVDPIDEHLKAPVRAPLLAMLTAVGLVLLIVCANVANLVLARGVEREREFAVRGALGAGRARLMRQVLTESVLLGAAGTAAGLALGWWLLRAIVAGAPDPAPGLEHAVLDWRVIAAAIALGFGTSAAFGAVPALHASRTAAADALRDGRSGTGGRRARGLRDGLAVAEIALAMVLVVGAGLALRSFAALVGIDPGFRSKDVAVLQVFAFDRINDTGAKRVGFFRDTVDRMAALPGATGAGAVSAMPFIEANINIEVPLTIEGRPDTDTAPTIFISAATGGYFDVMGIPVLAGRGFTRHDTAATEPVALVSESLARRHWPGADPVGAWVSVRFMGPPRRVKVVGVVGALRHDGYDAPVRDELFLPHAQTGTGSMTYVIGTAGNASALLEPARQIVWSLDPMQTFYDSSTVRDLLADSVAPRRFAMLLLAAFACVALTLAAAGVYGVISFTTSLRTREIGVRLALGASAHSVSQLVVGRALALGAIGVALGTLGSYAAGRAIESMLFGVAPFDPLTVSAVGALLLGVTATASYLPARRAGRVDPLVALKAE